MKYKSDTDIEKEFNNMNVIKIKVKPSMKSGWIEIKFPNANESVGGGTDFVCDHWIKYEHNGKIAFENWYPEKVYFMLCSYINDAIRNK